MQTAYNHAEWDFLEAWMKKIGFARMDVPNIMACIKSKTFSVKLNGELLNFFQLTRGIR